MKNLLKYSSLGLVMGACPVAFGLAFGGHTAPEIDPGLAIGALTLLAGTVAVLRIRRTK